MAGIGLILCLVVVAAIFGEDDAALPMICLTVLFGLAVLCRLVFEGMRDAAGKAPS